MSPPKTINAQKRFEIRVSETFLSKLDHLANLYSDGNRSQFVREYVEFLHENKSILEAYGLTSELTREVLNG